MPAVLSITAPIFLLIAIGYLAVKSRLLAPEAVPGLGRFVLYFALPAAIFSTVSRMNFGEIIDPSFVGVYATASLCSFTLGLLFSLYVLRNGLGAAGLKGIGMAIPNSMFIGYPVLLQVFGDPPANAFAMAVMVENIVVLPLALIAIEYGSGNRADKRLSEVWASVFGRVIRNPIIQSITAGLAASAIGLQLPGAVDQSLDMLARASAATALFVIGGSLVGTPIRGELKEISPVVIGKLLIHPLLVALMLWLLPPFDPELELAALLIAAMPMMSIYPIIGGNYGYGSQCASILILTTALSFVTVTVLLAFVT
ncbi:MAG: transporter [Oceanospirillaceae bacterium]|nr:transporter [Oceanospirillaceae bacterium]